MKEGKENGTCKDYGESYEKDHLLAYFLYQDACRNAHYGISHEETRWNESGKGELAEVERIYDVRDKRSQYVGYERDHKPEHHDDGQQAYSVESDFSFVTHSIF